MFYSVILFIINFFYLLVLPVDSSFDSYSRLLSLASSDIINKYLKPKKTLKFHDYQPSPEALGPCAPAKPAPELIDGEEEYEAEAILEDKRRNNRREYLVLWKGYPREDATWESESNLTNCKDLLQEYKHG